jgi:ACS family hexuronate transporter-like MFS transporter
VVSSPKTLVKAPIKNLRWVIAGLIFANTIVNYVDRQTLSVLAPELTRILHLSEVQYAYVVQAFLASYTLLYIPAGVIFDRWGVKFVFAVATAWWSFAAILPAFATSAWALGAYRFLLGIGEAFTFVGAAAVAAEWYPPRERALLNGLSNSAAVTGAVLTPPLIIWIWSNWGWRVAFIVTGVSGFVWMVLWLQLYDLPAKHPRITAEELRLIRGEPGIAANLTSEGSQPHWIELLRFRETWGLLISRTFSEPVWWFYLFWLPKYLTESRHLSMKQMGMIVWIPYLAADLGSIGGGWLSGHFIQRGWPILKARRRVMLSSALIMPLGIFIAYLKSSAGAIFIVCVVLFAHMSWKTNQMTLTVDVFPRPIVATMAGIVGTGGGLGAALFSAMTGHLLERYSYLPIFWIMGLMHPVAYFFVHWLVREHDSVPCAELSRPD